MIVPPRSASADAARGRQRLGLGPERGLGAAELLDLGALASRDGAERAADRAHALTPTATPARVEEVAQQRMTGRRADRLGVELHTLDGKRRGGAWP